MDSNGNGFSSSETERERRIRDRAYKMWEEEGCPEGCADTHWDKATELVAIEDGMATTLQPVHEPGPFGEPVEPVLSARNAGEVLAVQGDQRYPPGR